MGKILLVEDDLLIQDTTIELLEVLGHQVVAVNSGSGALGALDENNGKFDLVLLDLSLPDMSGEKLLPEFSARYSDLKVVICSGALPDELDFKDQPTVRGVLNKPYELSELRDIVDSVISAS